MFANSDVYRKTLKMMASALSDAFKVPFKHLKRVVYHGLILACIILGFWLLDSLKDPILANTIGLEYQPVAKLGSVVFTLIVVCLYDFLTSLVSKVALFHIVSWVFGIIIMIMAALLSNPVYGLRKKEEMPADISDITMLDDIALAISTSRYSSSLISTSYKAEDPLVDPYPTSASYDFSLDNHRYIGFLAYFVIEAYGSLMVALFWSFTNSITNLEDAKGAYGLIIALAQVGAILGSTLATNSSSIGIPQLFVVGSMSIFSISLLMKAYFIIFDDKYNRAHGQISVESANQRVRSASDSIVIDNDSESESDRELETYSGISISKGDTGKSRSNNNSISSNSNSNSNSIGGRASNASSQLMTLEELKARRDTSFYLQDSDDEEADDHNSDNKGSRAISLANKDDANQSKAVPIVSRCLSALSRFFYGFYEGLVLILQHSYTMKILGVSCLYEIIVTILDYEFKILAADAVAHHSHMMSASLITMAHHTYKSGADRPVVDQDKFANLLGHFGQLTNIVSLFVSFFLFSLFNNKLGVRYTLMIFPTFLLIAVLLVHLVPTLSILFIFVSIVKGLIFSLHDPTKELLYNPTSEPIKFKAKAWIDVFGSRFAKAIGSLITHHSKGDALRLQHLSEVPCLTIAAGLVYLAYSVGGDFQHLVDNKERVGDD